MSAVVPQAACAKVIRKLRPPFGAHDRKLCALFILCKGQLNRQRSDQPHSKFTRHCKGLHCEDSERLPMADHYRPQAFSPEQRAALGLVLDPAISPGIVQEPAKSPGIAQAKSPGIAAAAREQHEKMKDATLKRRALLSDRYPLVASALAADEAGMGMRVVQRLALQSIEADLAEKRVNTLRLQYSELASQAEEMQQQLERLAQENYAISLVPLAAEKKTGRARSPTLKSDAGSSALDKLDARLTSIEESSRALLELSVQLGGNHPQVVLETARVAVERQVIELEPRLEEVDDYTETLEMMLFRLRDAHASLLAHIDTLRDHGLQMDKEAKELHQLELYARGAVTLAQTGKRETATVLATNRATYARKLQSRRVEIELLKEKAARWEAVQQARARKQKAMREAMLEGKPRRPSSAASVGHGGKGIAAHGVLVSVGGHGGSSVQENLLRADDIQKKANVIYMSQLEGSGARAQALEAAFAEMARAAGAETAVVDAGMQSIIEKFFSRDEARRGLLAEQGRLQAKRTSGVAHLQLLTGRLAELRYSGVTSAQTEAGLKELEPKLTRAAFRLRLHEERAVEAHQLQLHIATGLAAVLRRVASCVPALGPAPDDHMSRRAMQPSAPFAAENAAIMGDHSATDPGAGSGAGTGAGTGAGIGAGTGAGTGAGAASVDDSAALEAYVLGLLKASESRLEKLHTLSVEGDEGVEGPGTGSTGSGGALKTAAPSRSLGASSARASMIAPAPPMQPKTQASAPRPGSSAHKGSARGSVHFQVPVTTLPDGTQRSSSAPGTTLRVSGAPTGLAAVYAEREAADLQMAELQAALLNVRVGPPVMEPTPVVTPGSTRAAAAAAATAAAELDEAFEIESAGFVEERRRVKTGDAISKSPRRPSTAAPLPPGGAAAATPLTARASARASVPGTPRRPNSARPGR